MSRRSRRRKQVHYRHRGAPNRQARKLAAYGYLEAMRGRRSRIGAQTKRQFRREMLELTVALSLQGPRYYMDGP